MVKIPVYCMICEQEIARSWMGKLEGIGFKNGMCCANCAKKKIDSARNQQ